MDNIPSLIGAWLRHVTHFKFLCPIHISGMAEARALKLCIKGAYIKSGQRDDKSPLKGAWLLLTWRIFCMHSCGVRTKSPLHSVICDQTCPGRWLLSITPPTVDAGAAYTIRLKLHRFDFSTCWLQTCWYNI